MHFSKLNIAEFPSVFRILGWLVKQGISTSVPDPPASVIIWLKDPDPKLFNSDPDPDSSLLSHQTEIYFLMYLKVS